MQKVELAPTQRRTVAAAITVLSAAIIIAFVGLLLWGLERFVGAFSGVFLPVAVAAILALILRPCHEALCNRLHLPSAVSVILIFLVILVPLAIAIGFFLSIAIRQLLEVLDGMPTWVEMSGEFLSKRFPGVAARWADGDLSARLTEAVRNNAGRIGQFLVRAGDAAAAAGVGAARTVVGLFGWFVLPVYLAFFLTARSLDVGRIETFLPFLKEDTRKDVVYLVREFVDILVAFFRGQLLIAGIQALLLAVGFSLVGLRYGFSLGLILGFLNIVPYLGSILTLVVTVPLAFFQDGGGWLTMLLVLGIIGIVQLLESYVLTPKIMGDRTGLHPVVIIVAVFFWGSALGGITGMILAIPLTAFLVVFWRLARDKYIREII